MSQRMFIKVDGVWHEANTAETETLCGLDPQDAEDYGSKALIRPGDKTCPACVAKAETPF